MISGSGRSSKRTSRGPYSIVPRMLFLSLPHRSLTGESHRVSRLLVELCRMLHDVWLIDFLGPLAWFDFFDGHGHRFVAVVQDSHHVLGDRLGEAFLLLFRLAGP